MKKNHFILFCILPSVIILLAVVIFPMIGAINYSLQDKSLRFLNGDYIGLQNYFEMFQDRRFINALKISLYWELITVVGSLILAIFVSIIYFGTCLIHLLIPSDPLHVVWHLMFNGLAPAAGHSGYNEISNKKDGDNSLPHASYFHYLHHKYFECNYGELLFPFDKWFGTFHDGTKESGEKIFGTRKLKE